MQIIRQIGRHELLIDTSEAYGISLSAESLGPDADSAPVFSKKQLLQVLSSGDEYYPLSMHWEVLDKCNLRCPFCYIVGHSWQRLLRFEEMRPHLDELVERGLLFCTLTGGEVTIHPDFCEIYTFLRRRGVLVEVFTNGLKLSDEILRAFDSYPPYAVEISIYTLNNDRLRTSFGAQGRHSAETVLANVENLVARGVSVTCKTFINTMTSHEADAIEAWCTSRGVSHYSSSDVTSAYDGADLAEFRDQGVSRPMRFLRDGERNVCFPCGTRNYGCAMTPALQLFPCSSIRTPDCYFDIPALGVAEALTRMKAFIRRFQDVEIQSTGAGKLCMASSMPIRDNEGGLIGFAQKASTGPT
jgi:MoaA/NifB/PqqE/SkfB family radical SAM enzyme